MSLKDRQLLRPLLRLDSPADALAAYYALSYDEKRVQLTVGRDGEGRVNGFAAVCQTGLDLFRPLVVVRSESPDAAASLLLQALAPGRPYYAIVPPSLESVLDIVFDIQERDINPIYEARRALFKPVINVLVVASRDSENKPRFVIRSASGDVVAESGLNWQSDEFAEVYVNVQPHARGRGLGLSVVSACTSYLLEAGIRPLYMTSHNNGPAIRLCQALGYTDTGAREYVCTGMLKAFH
jgi:N-acetylglutamate synthase-like GNAT family acetyltransferase